MKKLTVRWTQVYESTISVPKGCTPDNWREFMEHFDFNTNVEGAEGQVDTFEVLGVEEGKLEHNFNWSPAEMAEKTKDAYSADSFTSWLQVCKLLKARRFSDKEAEAILRSKWTRWCRDEFATRYPATSTTLASFLTKYEYTPGCWEVEELVDGTF